MADKYITAPDASLCFLLQDGKILLAKKKRKIGKGKWNGYGGKAKGSEDIKATAARELFTETGGVKVEPSALHEAGTVLFHFAGILKWKVHIFFVTEWEGEPKETDEMGPPQWFPLNRIPYYAMLPADQQWLPRALAGTLGVGRVYYDSRATNCLAFSWFTVAERAA